ncbi:Nuclear nucleic acid-binding protein C1D [Echinococcus granulosus]|uniref:Nuclear nucleic acid-binding protein C1D n=1 Tax=Echinococcus granulosus TaxID=6210 RepID=W6UPZ3_ECHGR|nr:Nuclear nucleic acid-binding protein C1D [Echinococcus granulosus]EUB63735.1 Nuclear nucleic acid-binding protein C1D [Echinococcus granulosus]
MTDMALFDCIPNEINELLVSFSGSIQGISDIIESYKEAMKTNAIELPPMQRVQTELSLAYAMNALFFVYLRCHGVDAKDHPILKELERLTACLKRCQNICSKQSSELSHSRLDKEASKRFVKRALWQSAQSKTRRRKLDSDS